MTADLPIRTDSAEPNLAEEAAVVIRAALKGARPVLAAVLGSGLGGIAHGLEDAVSIPYERLPGFPRLGVDGHAGQLVVGRIAGHSVIVMQGRKHVYEGEGMGVMAVPIRALKLAGAGCLLLTCAAGSLQVDVGPGRIMAITDHINLMPGNPLVGRNDDRFGPRFPPLDRAWSPDLVQVLRDSAEAIGLVLAEGVYAAMIGPSFETPAEVRMLQRLGADAVGMSTVPECILAAHCGLEVAGCAIITNLGVGLSDGPVNHDQTLSAAGAAARDLEALLREFTVRVAKR